jgi:hypothetical protein
VCDFHRSCRRCLTVNPLTVVCGGCANLNLPGGACKTLGCQAFDSRPFDLAKDKALAEEMHSMPPGRYKLERPHFGNRSVAPDPAYRGTRRPAALEAAHHLWADPVDGANGGADYGRRLALHGESARIAETLADKLAAAHAAMADYDRARLEAHATAEYERHQRDHASAHAFGPHGVWYAAAVTDGEPTAQPWTEGTAASAPSATPPGTPADITVAVHVIPYGSPLLLSESQLDTLGAALHTGNGRPTLRGPNGVHYPLVRSSNGSLILHMQRARDALGPVLLIGAPAGAGKPVAAMVDTGTTKTSVPLQDEHVLRTWDRESRRPLMTIAGPCETHGDGEITLRFLSPPAASTDPPPTFSRRSTATQATTSAHRTPTPTAAQATTSAHRTPTPTAAQATTSAHRTPAPTVARAMTGARRTPAPTAAQATTGARRTPAPTMARATTGARRTPAPTAAQATTGARRTPAPTAAQATTRRSPDTGIDGGTSGDGCPPDTGTNGGASGGECPPSGRPPDIDGGTAR